MTTKAAAGLAVGAYLVGMIVGAGIMAPKTPRTVGDRLSLKPELEACVAGWRRTIDDWNASTAQLNRMTDRLNDALARVGK